MGKGFRCFSYVLIGVALILIGTTTALAHTWPTTATATGVGISFTALRTSDGTTPTGPVLPGTVNQCETILYRMTVSWAGGVNANIFGGTMTITTPDAVNHVVTPAGGVPCLGPSDLGDPSSENCTGTLSINSNLQPFTLTVSDCAATPTVTASAHYSGGTSHIGASNTPGNSADTAAPLNVVCCAQDNTVCNGTEFCDPNATFTDPSTGFGRKGNCAPGTPLNCNDNNACTADTCDPVTGCHSTPISCNDNNACTTDTCDPILGCVHTPISCDDNNACTTDTCDPILGCVHTPISCNDNNACTADSCLAATGCVNAPISCDDNNACTTDTCDPILGCVHTAISCDDNNACTTDTCTPASGCGHAPISCDDNNPCTNDTCDPVLGCQHTDNGTCVASEICRTPGFWGTHACPETACTLATSVCEKANSQNITGIVLGNFTGACGPLVICGHDITNTCLNNQSTTEAICVDIKGHSELQVARQLTAAALNCILSKSGDLPGTPCTGSGENCADVCSGISVDAIFAACNTPSCSVTATIGTDTFDCIDALDCFNNGGSFDIATGTCSASVTSCHDRTLVNGCFSFEPPGPAGGPKQCNDAHKDNCSILCSVACSNTVACP